MAKSKAIESIITSWPLRRLKNFVVAAIMGSSIFCTFYWYILSDKHHGILFKDGVQDYWRWECDVKKSICLKHIWKEGETGETLRTCEMTCNYPPPLWPLPNGEIFLSNRSCTFYFKTIKIIQINVDNLGIKNIIKTVGQMFLSDIEKKQVANPFDLQTDLDFIHISISVIRNNTDLNLRINTDESYKLTIKREGTIIQVSVKSGTYFGARHALETLRQLIWFDELRGQMRIIENAKIVDAPLFSYRGLMLDTSNHYFSLDAIKRTIDGMAAVKMNIFHWHITDSFSFPFYFENINHAIYGAYSSKEIYTRQDIKNIADYALLRGIKLIMELDNPSHMDNGWNWGPRKGYGDINIRKTYQNDDDFAEGIDWCHQINPSNKHSYELIKEILSELNNLTGMSDLVHLGGDGIDLTCWKNSSDVRKMDSYKKKGLSGVLRYHQNQIYNIITDINKGNTPKIILWSDYFKRFNDPTKIINSKIYAAQITGYKEDQEEIDLIEKGYRVIISHQDKWFLNYLPLWTTAYEHRPWENMLWSEKEQILGGEACLWTELFDGISIDSKIWPTTAAIAEVLWSEPQVMSIMDATIRLQVFRERLIELGIMSAPVSTKWCTQNPGSCL